MEAKKGGSKKRTTVNSNTQASNGVSVTTTATSTVSPVATTHLTPSLNSTSLNHQNGSRKSRRVVSPASDTSGISTRTPTPPTTSGAAPIMTASTSSASSSPSPPSIVTPSADISEQPLVVSTAKSMSCAAAIGNTRQNLSHEAVPGNEGETTSISTPTSPTMLATDDLSVEPMTMEDDKKDVPDEVKIIPRLVDSAGQAAMPRGKDINLNPSSWTVDEVAQFLQINECTSLADAFQDQRVDGEQFLSLEKPDIMKLVNNKIGPSLKVENLLRLLKSRMNPAQARFVASMSRKAM